MPERVEHTYSKEDLIRRFDGILGKTLGEIDNLGIFEHVQDFDLQKGVAGTIIGCAATGVGIGGAAGSVPGAVIGGAVGTIVGIMIAF